MYNKFILSLLVLLLLNPATNKATNGEETNNGKISLRFNPSKGEQYKQLFEMSSSIIIYKVDEPDSKMEQESKMGSYYTTDIINAGDPTTVNMVYNRMYMKSSMFGMEVNVDTDSLELLDTEMKKEMAQGFLDMINKPIEMIVKSNGSITSSKYLEEGADNSNIQDMSQISMTFPDKPIGIGDSWQQVDPIVISEHEYIMQITYTLSKVDNGVAYITVNGETLVDPKSTKTTYSDVNLKNDQSGTIKINISTGWTISSDLKQIMSYVTEEYGDKYVSESTSNVKIRGVE